MTFKTFVLLTLAVASGYGVRAQHPILNDAEGRSKIENAVPTQTLATPARPRKLLIFDLNVGYGGHGSIAYANYAFKLMGEKTGGWATEISRDPHVFKRDNLSRFDAVFFNNTVGNLFEDSELRENLVQFIYRGGGMLGVHGTTVAFTRWPGAIEDWPEFGVMIGGRGANHKDSDERVAVKLDDPENPIVRCFGGKGFEYRDEFFRVQEPYSRNRLRILLSMDTEKFDPNQGQPRGNCFRADNDYALAWTRSYGRGRVFYCTIAHNPYVFWDATLLQFYQAAIQYALGDLPAPSTPSAKLTPAVRSREKLGWRLGMAAAYKLTFFESVDRASQLGLSYIGAYAGQKVANDIPKNLGPDLSSDQMRQIRLKLDAAGLRLLTLTVDPFPEKPDDRRRLFEFSRNMGVETLIGAPAPAALDALAGLCDEFDIQLALSALGAEKSAFYGSSEEILKQCQGRTSRIGGAANLPVPPGADPIQAARNLQARLAYVEIGADSRVQPLVDRPSGIGTIAFIRSMRLLSLKPAMIGIPCQNSEDMPQAVKTIEFFDKTPDK
jgi:type 1 glutamine amidotransferase